MTEAQGTCTLYRNLSQVGQHDGNFNAKLNDIHNRTSHRRSYRLQPCAVNS